MFLRSIRFVPAPPLVVMAHSLHRSIILPSVQHWDLNEMGYVETMFGHQSEINAIDSWRKERVVTGGRDRTVRTLNAWLVVHGYEASSLSPYDSKDSAFVGRDIFLEPPSHTSRDVGGTFGD